MGSNAAGPGKPVSYRQGTVLAWDPVTLENVILVGGSTFVDVPVLGVAEAASFTVGSVVGILAVGSTWAIIGRLVIPGTDPAAAVGSTMTAAGLASRMSYQQGTLTAWNPVTLENTVDVGGITLIDLPVLGVAEAATFTVGSVVGLAALGAALAIIGRTETPGTATVPDALSYFARSIANDTVVTAEDATSSTFGDLTTAGPQVAVLVPASGRVLVTVSATVTPDPLDPDVVVGVMDFDITGDAGYTRTPDAAAALTVSKYPGGASRVTPLDGLTPGETCTFTAKYLSQDGTSTFSQRTIIVETL